MSEEGKLQRLHSQIDIEIVKILLAVVPQSWNSIRLQVKYVELAGGEEGFPIKITNNEGKRDIVMPPEELYIKIREHSNVFKKYGKQWKKLDYNLTYDELQDDWQFTIDFEY